MHAPAQAATVNGGTMIERRSAVAAVTPLGAATSAAPSFSPSSTTGPCTATR